MQTEYCQYSCGEKKITFPVYVSGKLDASQHVEPLCDVKNILINASCTSTHIYWIFFFFGVRGNRYIVICNQIDFHQTEEMVSS